MTQTNQSIINGIKVGDYIGVGLLVGGGGYELITGLSSVIDLKTKQSKYTVVTAKRTLTLYDHDFQLHSVTPHPQSQGISYWLVVQST